MFLLLLCLLPGMAIPGISTARQQENPHTPMLFVYCCRMFLDMLVHHNTHILILTGEKVPSTTKVDTLTHRHNKIQLFVVFMATNL